MWLPDKCDARGVSCRTFSYLQLYILEDFAKKVAVSCGGQKNNAFLADSMESPSVTSLPPDSRSIATEEEAFYSSELSLPTQQGSLDRLSSVSERDSDRSSLHAALSAPSLDDGGQRERTAEVAQPSRRVHSANPRGKKGGAQILSTRF